VTIASHLRAEGGRLSLDLKQFSIWESVECEKFCSRLQTSETLTTVSQLGFRREGHGRPEMAPVVKDPTGGILNLFSLGRLFRLAST
jgi:hypothetical protein